MSPFQFFVPSMLNSGLGWWRHVIGILIWYARSLLMKFSIAPESSSDSILALLDAMCMYTLMVIDFLSNKYTWSSVLLLIQAAQIRVFKNPILSFLRLVLHSSGVVVLCLLGTELGLWLVVLRWDRWFVLAPFGEVGCYRPSLLVFVLADLLTSIHSWLLLVWVVDSL
jgi:hypothetical protein